MYFALEPEEYGGNDYYRIGCVPTFAGLCRFPKGQGFKQWTGDDSRALMKVHGEHETIKCYKAFTDVM